MTLSRRDEFAKAAMQALISTPSSIYHPPVNGHGVAGRVLINGVDMALITSARQHADALIAELDKTSSPKA